MNIAGQAKLHLGNCEQAVGWFRRSIEANRSFPAANLNLAAALALLGRHDEAHSAVKAGLALNPTFTISRVRDFWTARSDDPTFLAQLEPILEGMRKHLEFPNNDRRPPPCRDPRRRRGRLLSPYNERGMAQEARKHGEARQSFSSRMAGRPQTGLMTWGARRLKAALVPPPGMAHRHHVDPTVRRADPAWPRCRKRGC